MAFPGSYIGHNSACLEHSGLSVKLCRIWKMEDMPLNKEEPTPAERDGEGNIWKGNTFCLRSVPPCSMWTCPEERPSKTAVHVIVPTIMKGTSTLPPALHVLAATTVLGRS